MVHKPKKECGRNDKGTAGKGEQCMESRGENPVKIIRWSDLVTLPSGQKAYMSCRIGKMKEVMKYAQKIAKENGVTVEVVI